MSPRSIRRAHARRAARDERRAALRRRRSLAAGVVGAALLAPAGAQAATFTVTNTSDSGAGSLRAAITSANGGAGPDEIVFGPAVTGLIRLTTGQLTISANEDLTITGPGRDVLSISGDANDNGADGSDSRIFNITTPVGPTIAISGLTLTHGFDPANANGGAITDTGGAALALSNLAITDSKSATSGGGLATVGDYTLSGSTVTGNTAVSGGGIYARSNAPSGNAGSISDTTIAGNQATGSSSSSGGGIDVLGAALTLQRSTLSGNTAQGTGGGAAISAKYGVTISNSVVQGNAAETGGGLSLQSSTSKYSPIRVTETTISGNQGTHGAGVQASYIGAGNPVTIARSTISGNQGGANSFGGGILFRSGVSGHAQLVDSTVSGNTAATGGGISLGDDGNSPLLGNGDVTGSIDLDNSTIAGNAASGTGGGIYLSQYDSGSPTVKKSGTAGITSTIVAGNTANGAAQDLDRADTSTAGGFAGAFSLVQAPGDAPVTQQSMLIGVDPQLGALGDHGGPTATMLPAGTSPVIDQGRAADKLKVDQRNLDRIVDSGIPNAAHGGDGTDIGAVELAADQVVLPPPPPQATFDVTVRGKSITPGTPLLPANLLPFDCKVTVVSMTSCSIELRSLKPAKISRKVTIPKGALLADGVVSSANGATSLSVKVRLTRDGKDVLKAQPVGVDTIASADGATGTTSALTQKGVVHLLAGPNVTLGLGKRRAKLPTTVNKRLDQLAKLIPDAKTVSCTAFSDKRKTGDVALTRKQAKAACARLVKDGIKAKITVSGKGHAKPVASNRTKRGRALNRRIVIKFTL
jgi:outer membrane protein OmpA-like peptidoglycan-associated protein